MQTAYEIQEAAYAAFDAWLSEQDIEVQEMSLLEQIEIYAQQ
jgi:hypothetical protein